MPIMETSEMGLEVRYLKAMKILYIPDSFQLKHTQEDQSPSVAVREGMPEKTLLRMKVLLQRNLFIYNY
jgi:hypothetical protein